MFSGSLGKFLRNAGETTKKISEANSKIAKYRAQRYQGKNGVVSKAKREKWNEINDILSNIKDVVSLAEKIAKKVAESGQSQ